MKIFDLVKVLQRLSVQILQVLVGKLSNFVLVSNTSIYCQLVDVAYGVSRILVIDVDNVIYGGLVGERLRIEDGSLLVVRYYIHSSSVPRLNVRHIGCSSISRRIFHIIPGHQIVPEGHLISCLIGRFVTSHIVIQRFLFTTKSSIETLMTCYLFFLVALEEPSIITTCHHLLPLVQASCFGSLSLKLHEVRTGGGQSTLLAFLRMGRFHFLI